MRGEQRELNGGSKGREWERERKGDKRRVKHIQLYMLVCEDEFVCAWYDRS